ncbi:MAG TPA: SurA N-terminal domain-containing protein [Actinomycetota bacterium]|nr:SurA N-terminal domain-containing protein [Actinomycetota bacterium]
MRSLKLSALVVAGLVLSSCGGTFVPPAAVVNGVAISQAAVEDRLEAALADPSLAGQLTGPSGGERKADIARQVLALLIRQQILAGYAETHRVTVTGAEIQQSLSQAIEQIGGQAQFNHELKIRGLTVADVRENIRQVLLAQKVQQAVVTASGTPTDVSPQQADQIFTQWLTTELRRADIEVNPRFGAFDVKRATVCRLSSTAGDVTCPTA